MLIQKYDILKRTLVAFLAVSLLLSGACYPKSAAASSSLNRSVAGWIPYWDYTRAFSVIQNNADVFDEMNPYWYDLTSSGQLASLANAENATLISYAQNNGKKLLPLISNEFDGNLVSAVINNSNAVQTHINDIINKVTTLGYSGIEIDYENLLGTDRTAYTTFVQNLATALHAKGKTLTVVLPAKTSASQYPAFDYIALGRAVDICKIMAYDYSWFGSAPGSIAPYTWVDKVLGYSVTAIPPSKLMLGVPAYGYDWVGNQGNAVLYTQAIANAETYGAVINEDILNGPHYTYSLNGVTHTVWFENTGSVSTFFDLANKYKLNGVAIWRLGGEDAGIYNAARAKFSTSAQSGGGANIAPQAVDQTYALSKKSIPLNSKSQSNEAKSQIQQTAQDKQLEDFERTTEVKQISVLSEFILHSASQGNILTVNEAIQTVKKGDAGNGFAVLTNEVKKLVERSITTVSEIRNAIHSVMQSILNLVKTAH